MLLGTIGCCGEGRKKREKKKKRMGEGIGEEKVMVEGYQFTLLTWEPPPT